MNLYYVDTSALTKRYLNEVGSAWVLGWIEPIAGNITVISQLTEVEMFSMFARREREGTISPRSAGLLRSDFLFHVEREYLTVPLDRDVLTQARTLIGKHPLRALDSVQLACALQAYKILQEPLTFVSADQRLLTAAGAEGLSVDDPLAHP